MICARKEEIDFVISFVNDDPSTRECAVDYGLPNVDVIERLDVIEEGNAVQIPSEKNT